MRRFQDRYHAEVSLHHGQARLGPKRRRLTRAQWKKEQAQAETLVLAQKRANAVHQQIETDLQAAAEQAQVIVDASQEEANHQRQQAEQERLRAEQERQQAEVLKQLAKEETRQAAELKVQVEQVKSVLDERAREMSKYDGMFGRVLGWLGIRQRIERNAEAKFQQQIAGMKKQVDRLSARIDRDDAVKKQHDHAVGALNALQRALSVSADDYPALKETGALQGHFEYIQRLMNKNLSAEQMKEILESYMDELQLSPFKSQSSDEHEGLELDC